MTEIKEIHIGQLVKSVFDSSGMSVSELARRLHCERTNVYTIFRRRTMDVELLAMLSKILNHNFLEDVIKLYGLSCPHSQLNIEISLEEFNTEIMSRLTELLTDLKKKL